MFTYLGEHVSWLLSTEQSLTPHICAISFFEKIRNVREKNVKKRSFFQKIWDN